MSDLPPVPQTGNITNATPAKQDLASRDNPTNGITVGTSGGTQKEVEIGGVGLGELPITDLGKEMELPKEVSSIGVTTEPTVVPIPQPVSQLGVKPTGANVTIGTGSAVTLPLTNDQIKTGLKQSIISSWRWLAEWCKRKLLNYA